jgi:hypothetical protein
MVNIRDSAEFATTSRFGMPAEPRDFQLDLVHRNPGQDLRMLCRINKQNALTPWMKTMNIPSRREQAISPIPSDRAIVLGMCGELVRVGYGILEDLPVVNSQILYLKSGEIYWLGPHEVMRIQ